MTSGRFQKKSQLSNRGKAFSTRHLLISSTLKLEFKSLTELEKHASKFGISINTSSSNEGISNSVTSGIFLNFNFVRDDRLSRDGIICHPLQSSRWIICKLADHVGEKASHATFVRTRCLMLMRSLIS